MKKPARRLRATIESLEPRQMMAGDVTVTLVNKVLTLTGDAASNGVFIGDYLGKLKVAGIDVGGSATTVNGNSRLTFTDASIRQINVNFGAGNDKLVLSNTHLEQGLNIQMGLGNDVVGLGRFDDVNHLIPDTVDTYLGSLVVDRDVVIDLGAGNNTLLARDFTIGHNFTLTSGIGNDTISLTGRGNPTDAGYIPGIKVLYDTAINTGGGQDSVTLDRMSSRILRVDLGLGDDDLYISNLTLSYPLRSSSIDGGGGDDILHDLGNTPGNKQMARKNFEQIV